MISPKIIVTVALLSHCSSLALAEEFRNLKIYEKKAPFSDVREDLVDAIINQGYVIDYNGRPSEMLKQTQEDVGGRPLYRQAEYMVFCSAVFSRNTMESDLRNIGYCPYIITAYETVQNPGSSYLSHRKLTFNNHMDASLIAVESMLDEIAREAVE